MDMVSFDGQEVKIIKECMRKILNTVEERWFMETGLFMMGIGFKENKMEKARLLTRWEGSYRTIGRMELPSLLYDDD